MTCSITGVIKAQLGHHLWFGLHTYVKIINFEVHLISLPEIFKIKRPCLIYGIQIEWGSSVPGLISMFWSIKWFRISKTCLLWIFWFFSVHIFNMIFITFTSSMSHTLLSSILTVFNSVQTSLKDSYKKQKKKTCICAINVKQQHYDHFSFK